MTMPDTPPATRAQIEREIAEGLDRLAAERNSSLRDIPEDSYLWTQNRHFARAFRMAADHVRAGLYLEEKARG